MLSTKKRKPILDAEMQLHTIPICNTRVQRYLKDDDPDTLIVEVRLKPKGLLAFAMKTLKAKNVKKYALVGVSRKMYEAIDGQKSVEDFVDLLMADYQLTFLEARGLTIQYLSDLMKRGLVVILPPDTKIPKQDQGSR